MTDVIMRRVRKGNQSPSQYCPNCEAQAAEIERLRDALKCIASGCYSGTMLSTLPWKDPAVEAARKALEQST